MAAVQGGPGLENVIAPAFGDTEHARNGVPRDEVEIAGAENQKTDAARGNAPGAVGHRLVR